MMKVDGEPACFPHRVSLGRRSCRLDGKRRSRTHPWPRRDKTPFPRLPRCPARSEIPYRLHPLPSCSESEESTTEGTPPAPAGTARVGRYPHRARHVSHEKPHSHRGGAIPARCHRPAENFGEKRSAYPWLHPRLRPLHEGLDPSGQAAGNQYPPSSDRSAPG